MSNAIVKQSGPRSVAADNLWQFRLGAIPFAAGLLAAAALRRGSRPPDAAAPTPAGWPVNFAHRGGASVVTENTVEGFREAAALGPVVLELDARLTADGAVVVFHDDRVDRTTNGTGTVARLPLARLQSLDAGHRFTPDGGTTFPWRGRGVTVPTLETVYREFPDHVVNVELKGDRPGTEARVWEVIAAAHAESRTLVVGSGGPSIRRFRAVSGGAVATAASGVEFALFWLLALLRLDRLYAPSFQALQPPDTYRGFRVVTPGLVRRAHRRGLRVDVWTIDDEADMRRLLEWGVDGIMTDRPDLLARVVAEQEAALPG